MDKLTLNLIRITALVIIAASFSIIFSDEIKDFKNRRKIYSQNKKEEKERLANVYVPNIGDRKECEIIKNSKRWEGYKFADNFIEKCMPIQSKISVQCHGEAYEANEEYEKNGSFYGGQPFKWAYKGCLLKEFKGMIYADW